MGKIDEALQILKDLGLPKQQLNERTALTLLALCQIRETDDWSTVTPRPMCIVGNSDNPRYEGIMRFISKDYGKDYKENSRESIRRFSVHQLVQAGIVVHNPENPHLPTNSKDNHYQLSDEAKQLLVAFKTKNWEEQLELFIEKKGTLKERYAKKKELNKIPVTFSDGRVLYLSPGKHNLLQQAIIEEFAPRFAPGGKVVYLGDTADKNLSVDYNLLEKLHIPIDQHSKLPDVVIFLEDKNWLFLIEAVTSHGPVSSKRMIEIEELLKDCTAGKVYVSAFLTSAVFRQYATDIAWETEVWLEEAPDHMIHFNGDRFFGPRK